MFLELCERSSIVTLLSFTFAYISYIPYILYITGQIECIKRKAVGYLDLSK